MQMYGWGKGRRKCEDMVGFFVPSLSQLYQLGPKTQPPPEKQEFRASPVDILGREEERESKREIFLTRISQNIIKKHMEAGVEYAMLN